MLADEDSPVFLPPAWNMPAAMWATSRRRSTRSAPARAWRGVTTTRAWLTARPRSIATGIERASSRSGCRHSMASSGASSAASTSPTSGWATDTPPMLMAEAFPNSRFHGFDTHATVDRRGAPQRARGRRRRAHRVRAGRGAKDYSRRGFGLICFFDALHDMGDPVGVLSHAAERSRRGRDDAARRAARRRSARGQPAHRRPDVLRGLEHDLHRALARGRRRARARCPGGPARLARVLNGRVSAGCASSPRRRSTSSSRPSADAARPGDRDADGGDPHAGVAAVAHQSSGVRGGVVRRGRSASKAAAQASSAGSCRHGRRTSGPPACRCRPSSPSAP